MSHPLRTTKSPRRRRLVPLLTLGLLSLLAATPTQPASTQPARATFKSTKHGFSLTYPRGVLFRQKVDVPNAVLTLAQPADDVKEIPNHVQVMVVPTTPNERLDPIVQSMADRLKNDAGQVQVEETTLAGQPARTLVYQRTLRDQPLRFRQLIAVNNSKAYVLTIVAHRDRFDDFLPPAQSVVDSFQWRP